MNQTTSAAWKSLDTRKQEISTVEFRGKKSVHRSLVRADGLGQGSPVEYPAPE